MYQKEDFLRKEAISREVPGRKQIIATPSSPINMSLEEAEALGKSLMGEIRGTFLKFIPYWKYDYTVNVDRIFEGERIRISESGTGFVNAINGEYDSLNFGEIVNQTEIPDIAYEQRQPEISKEEIREEIIERVIKANTRDIKTNVVNAQVVMYENKVFKPKESDINLKIKQVYAPIWEVKGKRKSLEISAYTGKPLEMPADDGVEFV